MKTKYITLTAAFLFSFCAQAQSDEGSILEGIQSSLSNMFDNTIQGTEVGRLFMLFNSDIRMKMKAHDGGYEKPASITNFDGFLFMKSSSDASMYAEFDWDNKALSMHLKKSENSKSSKFQILRFEPVTDYKRNEAIDHYQFTDKEGYWYVPYERPPYRASHIKFNAKRAAQAALEEFSDQDLQFLVNEIVNELAEIFLTISLNQDLVELINSLFEDLSADEFAQLNQNIENLEQEVLENIEDMGQLETIIRNLLNERYTDIVGFPVFIHWAFIYSPDFIREKYTVTETTYNCNGIPNGCTKLTVASGNERGKNMIFDQYNRLIYIDSKEEGSVQFYYDRDVTVILPPAWDFSDIMGDALERGN